MTQSERPETAPTRPPLHLGWATFLTLMCGGLSGMLLGLADDPTWVQRHVVEGAGVTVARALNWLTSAAPFSVAEVLIGLGVLWVLWRWGEAFSDLLMGRDSWWRLLLREFSIVAATTSVVVFWFYASWGLSYFQPPVSERLGLEVLDQPPDLDEDELFELLERAVRKANAAYVEVHGSTDAGEVTHPPEGFNADGALEVAYARLGEDLGLPESFGARRGPTKVMWVSEALCWMGIGGIYLPFTGEANINGNTPAWTQPQIMAHEKAHQRMVASEDEANFFGYLAGVRAQPALIRYGAWVAIYGQLLRAAIPVDVDRVRAMAEQRLPGVRRDAEARAAFWQRYDSQLDDLHRSFNDVYLKANNVEGGVAAYARAVQWIVAWSRTADGRVYMGPSRTEPM